MQHVYCKIFTSLLISLSKDKNSPRKEDSKNGYDIYHSDRSRCFGRRCTSIRNLPQKEGSLVLDHRLRPIAGSSPNEIGTVSIP
jgi:hypothetical protein